MDSEFNILIALPQQKTKLSDRLGALRLSLKRYQITNEKIISFTCRRNLLKVSCVGVWWAFLLIKSILTVTLKMTSLQFGGLVRM